MKITNPIRISILSSALLLASATAHALPFEVSAQSDSDPYAMGTRAMNDQHWSDAVASFDKVVTAKSKRSDAALYWKAYSLNKLGNKPLALATCYQLRSQYSSSRWNKDCDALSIDLRADGSDPNLPQLAPIAPIPPIAPVSPKVKIDSSDGHFHIHDSDDSAPHGSDEDLKILALNSLLNQDPSKAIPLLRNILTSPTQSMNVKKHALFVLAQSKSPEAEAALHDAVLGKMDPELQRQAIQSMAVFQGKRANDTLAEVYRTSSDMRVKKSIINAFFITDDAPRMVELARNEKDLELKRTIVSQLALMHDKAATDYMLELLK